MSLTPAKSSRTRLVPVLFGAAVLAFAALAFWGFNLFTGPRLPFRDLAAAMKQDAKERKPAPEFPTKKMDWLNTAGPIKLADLKGKIVILDFWTLCCINCIHILPDLAKLEKKYPNELVVIGVHSAKFDSEKLTPNIRKAVLRYEIAHPVVNDADHDIWDAYGINSWPSYGVIDAEGKYLGQASGEGKLELLDQVVAKLIEEAKEKKILNEKPIRFDLIRFRETGDTPLFFPGKITASESTKRLAIADSTHHRVVVTDLTGNKEAIIGTGSPGYKDGKFAEAQFDDPQGLAFDGDTLYVADRKNHVIRAADLKAGTIKTIAGTGKQDGGSRLVSTPEAPLKTGLNSPWDILLVEKQLYVAMAGHHQIWKFDLTANTIQPFSGNGSESIEDGPLYAASFAQPSGLTTDGKFLYVADSEGSAIRKLPLAGEGRVSTLVGKPGRGSLFNFGDKDGIGEAAQLQHALAVASSGNRLLIADTYNSKLKTLDPVTKELKTILGGIDPNDKDKGPLLNEPAGLCVAGNTLYIADTNAHRIRTVDLKTNAISTLTLTGVEPPPPQKEWLPKEPMKK